MAPGGFQNSPRNDRGTSPRTPQKRWLSRSLAKLLDEKAFFLQACATVAFALREVAEALRTHVKKMPYSLPSFVVRHTILVEVGCAQNNSVSVAEFTGPKHIHFTYLRSIPNTSAEGYVSAISMAQMPVPVPTSRMRCGLSPIGALCSFRSSI
jgi:hypothetical protein